jgi:Protein of unknown function (DUF1579)
MHRGLVGFGCVLLSALTLEAQTPDPKPGPEHKKLEVFAGDWTYEGETKATPLGPAGKVTGTDHNELLGGYFLVRRYEEKNASGTIKGIEVLGFDSAKKTYTDTSFDSSGVAASGTIAVTGNTWSFSGTLSAAGQNIGQRCTLVVGATSTSFTVKCDASVDGTSWLPVYEGRWTKAKTAP